MDVTFTVFSEGAEAYLFSTQSGNDFFFKKKRKTRTELMGLDPQASFKIYACKHPLTQM